MNGTATGAPAPALRRGRFGARLLLLRHQLAAGVGTAADFAAMIAGAELLHLAPPVATLLSAMVGGIVNFTVSRQWAFGRAHSGTLRSQAVRYGLAMVGGALLNAAVLAAVLAIVRIPYPVARAIVALLVSVLYSYPVHTRFVFRVQRRASSWDGSGPSGPI